MKVDEDDNTLGDFLARHGSVGAKPAFADGTEIGEWRITGFIGRGGSSEVYCVRNGATGEPAALKILHRTEQQHLDRFAREVHFLETHAGMAVSPSVGSRVPRDRHFPRFFAKGTCDGRPYVVQELLEPLPLPRGEHEIARFLCSVAEGVRDLHACGLVHRDIKPANILWRLVGSRVPRDRERTAVPVIIDFGLLKEISTASMRPNDSISVVDGKEVGVGTPRYAAPEQFAGGEATPATDIHALGRLAYECFNGHSPRVWSGIIRRATSSIPKERYQTAKEFICAIRGRHRPRRMLAALLGTGVVVSLIAFGVSSAHKMESPSAIPARISHVGNPETSSDAAKSLPVRSGEEGVQWTLSGMDVTTNVIQLVFHHQILVTNEVTIGGSGEKQKIVHPQKFFQAVTNAVDATIVNLNGATNRFDHPLKLNPKREYWVVGPGTLNAVFKESQGVTMRLANCRLVNRAEESLRKSGIRYILYKGSQLDFPAISRDAEEECEFLVMSDSDFPNDNAAFNAGAGPDHGFVKISYRITEKELQDKLLLEKEIIRARLKQEMRHNPKFRDIDADRIVR